MLERCGLSPASSNTERFLAYRRRGRYFGKVQNVGVSITDMDER
jgi:hypothetical protein